MSLNEQRIGSLSLTPEQSAEYEALLWEKAEQVGELRTTLQKQLEVMYAEIEAKKAAHPNLHELELLAQQESEYWNLYRQLQEMNGVEETILKILERIEEGSATEEEILATLPTYAKAPTEEEKKESKRKQAIARQERFTPETTCTYLGEAGLLYLFGGYPSFGYRQTSTTDPRRIASGRNRRRVSSGNGVSETDFYEATADTHGGKSRRPGKSGGAYVGKNGKKIRKY
jgi:hypothetical protein